MKKAIVIWILFITLGVGIGTACGWLGQETARDGNPVVTKTVQTDTIQKGLLGENVYGTIGLWSGYITGHSKSSTVGMAEWWEGESEFPLSNFFLGLEGVLAFRNPGNSKQDRGRLALAWLTNVDSNSGTAKHTEWWNFEEGPELYVESDSGLKAHILDVNAIYNFWPLERLSIGPMVGYRYQHFNFNFWDYSGTYYGSPMSGVGHLGDYTHNYHIPYWGLNSDFLFSDTLRFNSKVAFTYGFASETGHLFEMEFDEMYIDATDYEGNFSGPGVLLNVNANWEFMSRWLLQLGGEYTRINTGGTSDLFYDGEWSEELDAEMDYSAWIISAYLKYMF